MEKFNSWKNEMDMLDERLNNLDANKVIKPEEVALTPQSMKAYLKGKGKKTLERDTDPKTGEALDKPIDIPLAKATKEELQGEYFAAKELAGEEVALAGAKAGAPAIKEIAAETTRQISEKWGLADVEVAGKVVEDLKSVDIKSLPEGQKDSKRFLDRQELDSSKKQHIEPQSKETNMILVDWLNSLKSKTSTNAMAVTRFLKESGKKKISDITYDDINKWVKRKVEAGENIDADLKNISNILNHASDRGFITKLPATRKQMEEMWTAANEAIKLRSKEVKGVAGKINIYPYR